MKYRYLSHTADAKFQAYGTSLEEAFTHAAWATAGLIWDRLKLEPEKKLAVNLSGSDLPQLLVLFLEEILFLLDTQAFLLRDAKDLRISEENGRYFLKAVFHGIELTPDIKTFGQVKAVTYNEMKIELGPQVMLQVVVDM